jgi:integrase/recombinase XerD
VSELELHPSIVDQVEHVGPTRRVRVLIASWLAAYDSVHTQRAYTRDMKVWVSFCAAAGVDPLHAIRPHLDTWRVSGAGFADPKPASVARRLSAVASWYGYLVAEDVLERSPAAHIRYPKVGRDSTTRGLTREEAKAMLAAAAEYGRREAVLVSLGLLSGLRCAEMVLADVEDLGQDRGHRTLDVIRKGGTRQRIPLAPPTVGAVDAYLEERQTGPLLVTRTGARISPSQTFRAVRLVARRAGIEEADRVSPHSLRHAFITLSLDSGAALRDVQDAAGHVDVRTTVRYDRARGKLDRNPTYGLTSYLSD